MVDFHLSSEELEQHGYNGEKSFNSGQIFNSGQGINGGQCNGEEKKQFELKEVVIRRGTGGNGSGI